MKESQKNRWYRSVRHEFGAILIAQLFPKMQIFLSNWFVPNKSSSYDYIQQSNLKKKKLHVVSLAQN